MTSEEDPYAAFRDAEQPKPDDLGRISSLVREMRKREAEVEEASEILAQKQRALQELRERELPETMKSFGLDSITTSDGFRLTIEERVRASVPKERRPEAYSWVENDGNSGLIKRTVVIPFGREREAEAQEILDHMKASFPDALMEKKIEPSTLAAYVRRKLAAGEHIPMDLFGVHVMEYAKVKEPKR